MLSKNTSEGVNLKVKLPALSLQACKFTKNKLLHIHFSRISARFSVITFCAFSRNHILEGCCTFQWGGGCYADGRASLLTGDALHGGIGFDGAGGF